MDVHGRFPDRFHCPHTANTTQTEERTVLSRPIGGDGDDQDERRGGGGRLNNPNEWTRNSLSLNVGLLLNGLLSSSKNNNGQTDKWGAQFVVIVGSSCPLLRQLRMSRLGNYLWLDYVYFIFMEDAKHLLVWSYATDILDANCIADSQSQVSLNIV